MQILQSLNLSTFVLWALSAVGIYSILRRLFGRSRTNSFRPYVVPSVRRPMPDITDSAEQLRTVMRASFTAKKVMSFAEYQVFKEVEAEIRSISRGYRVFAQTSLGEILTAEDRRAHSAINSKRIDVLIIGPTGMPLLAIEHQGKGHYQGDAAARDAVKKEALRRAGVSYLEFFDTHTPEQIRTAVRDALVLAERPESIPPVTVAGGRITVA